MLDWLHVMTAVAAASRYHSRCTYESVMIIAILGRDGHASFFCTNLALRFVEVEIRTVGCAEFFPCGVLAAGPARRALWQPSDYSVPVPMVAAFLASQGLL